MARTQGTQDQTQLRGAFVEKTFHTTRHKHVIARNQTQLMDCGKAHSLTRNRISYAHKSCIMTNSSPNKRMCLLNLCDIAVSQSQPETTHSPDGPASGERQGSSCEPTHPSLESSCMYPVFEIKNSLQYKTKDSPSEGNSFLYTNVPNFWQFSGRRS